jgi:CheY-like chemotaxis protein
MKKKKILLVEDEAVTAMDMKANLLDLGYEVPMAVASGEGAILAAIQEQPDLILMDIKLDGPMSGIEAADVIWKNQAIPVVFLTAHADTDTIWKAKKVEPFGYLPKPCNMETLMTTLAVVLYKSDADAARRKAELERERLVVELQEALAKVKLLSGFLPICASCKKIRDDQGYWHQIEEYIRDHSEAEFTHGICQECAKKLYPNFMS